MTESVSVPARAEELGTLHDALARFWEVVDANIASPPDQGWRLRFATAVSEIATNVVRYAYRGCSAPGSLRLELRFYKTRVVARFTDTGNLFTKPTPAARPFDDDALELPEGGYGLAVARVCLDQLNYTRSKSGVNTWRLMKRLKP
ncbi:MAG: ATP-binding protein [Chloroflexota bacterium]|nr:ATP-binding protein [Chloroflexota bacterium]